MKPNFFLIGAAKCGTTSMYAYLRQHPNIFMPKMKEPNYFSSDSLIKFRKRIKSEKEYFQLFKNVKDEKMIGEASPTYLYSKVAAENIKRFNPESRIIIMLRNPVDAICSMYHMRVRNGLEHILYLDEALAKEIKLDMLNSSNQTCNYIEHVQFSQQITRYTTFFDKNKIHFILLDDLKDNPIIVLQRVFEFLQVDSSFLPDLQIHNPARPVRNLYLSPDIS